MDMLGSCSRRGSKLDSINHSQLVEQCKRGQKGSTVSTCAGHRVAP
jgi:hypothetical protein